MLVLTRDHPPASALRCWGYRYASECPSSNYFSNVSLYVCFHSTTAYNSTLPCLITRSLVALSLRFSLSSNSEKTVKNDITQWLCSSWRTSHYTEHSQAVLTSKYYSYLPDQKKKKKNKQGSERIIYSARSKGINSQNSDPNLKAQASKPQSLPSMAWLAAWEADVVRSQTATRTTVREWDPGSLSSTVPTARQFMISPPTELLLWDQRLKWQ